MTRRTLPAPIAIYHEHPDWFRPLFAELERRDVPYVRVDAAAHSYDPTERDVPWSLVFNRASPSAHLRGHGQSVVYTLHWLRHLQTLGVPVVNGADAYALELSKANQLDLLQQLGLPFPRSRVFNSPSRVREACRGFRFPVLIKASVGGSGAGITRYESLDALRSAADDETLDFGPDGTALVQEAAPLGGGHITRVETLGGKYLYAIDVYPDAGSFDLCPADACRTSAGVELIRGACATDAPSNGLRVEAATPPRALIEAVERIAAAASLDVGGIEYLVDARDGLPYFYDINALSNFVADAPRVIGFDPFARLVDYLEWRASPACRMAHAKTPPAAQRCAAEGV
ncbi:MAG: ATP-grasp domain-containing protein [Gemmatimonadales bacterium]